jgi:hypothetical protein
VTVIWTEAVAGWEILQPSGFPHEAQLHELIARAPQVLPLSGNPRLIVLGAEVPLGTGFADIVAIEASGRLVVIEVKLAKNPESRRAVVAQILAYASTLYRNSPQQLTGALAASLAKNGFASVVDAVAAADQESSIDPAAFAEALASSMATGDIRLVLVLDSAPPELVGVVGYLGAIAPNLTLDLITVTAFDVGDQRVIVPQRIEPEKLETPAPGSPAATTTAGRPTTYTPGAAEFASSIEVATPENRPGLRRYLAWAESLAAAGLATLRTGRGRGRWTLLPAMKRDDVGLVTIMNENGPVLIPWRSVFEKWAPDTLAALDTLDPPLPIARGNNLRDVPDEVLALLTRAYEEAARSQSSR